MHSLGLELPSRASLSESEQSKESNDGLWQTRHTIIHNGSTPISQLPPTSEASTVLVKLLDRICAVGEQQIRYVDPIQMERDRIARKVIERFSLNYNILYILTLSTNRKKVIESIERVCYINSISSFERLQRSSYQT